MWVVDSDNQNFLAVNGAAVEHYGYSRDQFLDMTTLDVRPAEDREEFEKIHSQRLNEPSKRIWRHKIANGSCIYVSVYARSLNYQGRNARINAIVDVTTQKLAEDELLKQKGVTKRRSITCRKASCFSIRPGASPFAISVISKSTGCRRMSFGPAVSFVI